MNNYRTIQQKVKQILFPAWEQNIPSLGTKHSHLGNKTGRNLVHDELTAHPTRAYGSCLASFLRPFSSKRAKLERRLVVMMLLMMFVGVNAAWGAFTEGLYYIRSNSNTAFYLCPSIGCYYDNNVDQPHLTTFQTNGDQYSIWKIVPTGETDTYYIIHYKTGRYLKSNENFTTVEGGNTKNNRKAVHLEVKPATLTDEENNKFKFLIKNNSSTYQIYPKVYYTNASGMSFNPTNEHRDCYAPEDGAIENGGARGMIGLFDKSNAFSKWQILDVASDSTPCATPKAILHPYQPVELSRLGRLPLRPIW